MSDLRAAVVDYLALRRQLGYSLERAERLLNDFAGYLEDAGVDHVTTALALAWATQPRSAQPGWWRQRLSIVRGFARHHHTIDPRSEVPAADLLPGRFDRLAPHLFSDDDIAKLLAAAVDLRPGFRAATYQTLIGLLAVTGLRLGEAVGLDQADVDLTAATLVVRRAKFNKSRQLCLHPTTVDALAAYAALRDQQWPDAATPAYFVSSRGTRLSVGVVHYTFPRLVAAARLEPRGGRCRPRPHDLRHAFAVRTLLGWYRDGEDVDALLPLLSTHMGHVDPRSTYWYLQAAPELLAVASGRLDLLLGDQQ